MPGELGRQSLGNLLASFLKFTWNLKRHTLSYNTLLYVSTRAHVCVHVCMHILDLWGTTATRRAACVCTKEPCMILSLIWGVCKELGR